MMGRLFVGVAAGLIAVVVALMFWHGKHTADVDALDVAFFPVHLFLNWLIAIGPFILVRRFGGFRNAWRSAIGGVATAALMFPIQVWIYIRLDIEGTNPPYFATLAEYGVPGWPLIVIGGAVGGLTCWVWKWLVEWAFGRLNASLDQLDRPRDPHGP